MLKQFDKTMKQLLSYTIVLVILILPFFFWKWFLGRKKPEGGVNNAYAAFLSVVTGIVIISIAIAWMVNSGK